MEWTRLRRMRCRSEWNCKPIALPASGRTAPKQSGNSSNLVMLRLPCRPLRQSEMIVCNDGLKGYVVPDAFTHGTSAQRVRWFMTGLKSGAVGSCDTFRAEQI